MKICILGDTGLLGQALVRFFGRDHEVLGISTSKLQAKGMCARLVCDVLQEPDIFSKAVEDFKPALVINCAAMVDVKRCEDDPQAAMRLNGEVPRFLARLCVCQKADFIHISTDQVFNGLKNAPYVEADATGPVNQYGVTKLEGERAVLEAMPEAYVIRTNIVGIKGDPAKPTFGEWLCRALERGEVIMLAEDFVTSSIHVDLFSERLWDVYKNKMTGLSHLASADSASKYVFGKLLAEALGTGFSFVKKVRLSDLGLVPPRPPYLVLSGRKAEQAIGKRLPTVHQTVKKLAEDYLTQKKEGSHAKAGG